MKNRINKAKTIVKAFSNPLPIGEDWFEERMKECDTCEYNTKNISKGDLTFTDNLKLKTGLCPEGDHCTACGCCTHRKASQKSEECGLADIGKKPKWYVLEVQSEIDKNITTENLTPDIGTLKVFDKQITYDLGEVSADRIDFSILMRRKGGFRVKSTSVGCKCTVADPVKVDENSYKFDIALSTKDFKEGVNITRTFTAEYYSSSTKVSEITVKIKLKKL